MTVNEEGAHETSSNEELLPFRQARRELLDQFEIRYISALLSRCNGRVKDAARTAGINPRSLYEKMTRHGIRKEFFKLIERDDG